MPQYAIPVEFKTATFGTAPIQTSAALDITSLTWAANVVTAVTVDPLPSPLVVGDTFSATIAGETPSGYNGQYLATVTGASGFTYPLGSDPGSETIQGTFTILTSVVKPTHGVLVDIIVITAGSAGNLTFNNCSTLDAADSTNEIITIAHGSLSVGKVITLNFPCNTGIVISAITTGGVISVTYS